MRTVRFTALLLASLACACVQARPTSSRELQSTDLKSCFIAAKAGNQNLHGTASVYQYVDVDGAVPASWVHDVDGIDSAQFTRCLGSIGVLSKFEGEKMDYLRGWVVQCEGADCLKGVVRDLTKPMDEKIAKDSLAFADWATDTDKGWGLFYTHQYNDAIAAFRKALTLKADDLRAQRGLAQALVESGGDLKEAREVADKALAEQKNAGTIEALVRVCLKQGDDECVVKNFSEVGKAEGVHTRSLELAQLNELAKAALARLEQAEKSKAEAMEKARLEALQKADPAGCYKETQQDAKAACYVKRCFGEGATKYAAALKAAMGQDFTVGAMVMAAGAGEATLVTIPIRGPEPKKNKKGKAEGKADQRDATWAVTLGASVDMKPYKDNINAYNIAKDFNACK
ncbi:MAG: tetratricopeptide repeat protein [Deltaproteobacteria bacterium]|nr:tetratricopeptide repeat protein [Deltaproteobacteria bacterium]